MGEDTIPLPADRRSSNRRRLIVVIAVLSVLAAIAAFYVDRWLHEKPLDDASVAPTPAVPVETVRRADLVPVLPDGGVDAGADADASTGLRVVDVSTAPLEAVPGTSVFTRTRNLLVIGADRKPWGAGGGLADTIMLVAMDRENGHAGILSIPRDFYVDFGNGDFGRINTAFSAAGRYGMSRNDFLKRIVGNLLGIRIHNVVIVDLTVLERAIDIVDGVDVIVPCPIVDNFIDPRTETGRRVLEVPAGTVHMDGVTAQMYARSRHGRSDWDRARRQQAIILALRRRVTSGSGVRLLPQLLDEVSSHVQSDMTRSEMLDIASFGASISPNQLHGIVLASAASQAYRTPTGQSVLIPDQRAIVEQSRGLFQAASPGAQPDRQRCQEADVAVRDGTTPRPRPLDPNAPPPLTPPSVGDPVPPPDTDMAPEAAPEATPAP
jgi:LCP family protein required for cell wall assembly